MGVLVTLDFETIPDISLADYLTKYKPPELPSGPDQQDIVDDLYDRVKALDGYARKKFHTPEGEQPGMLPPGLNKIVIAGIHMADIRQDPSLGEWYETKHLSSTAEAEQVILKNLIDWFTRMMPRFVTFNGRTFDFPLMCARALSHGLAMPFYYKQEDKWNNYQSRYSLDWHFDIMDFLTSFGAASRMSLREVMALLRLPDKIYSGGDVVDLLARGEVSEAREYCEFDCLNTFLGYVHCQHLRGAISILGRNASISSALNFLKGHIGQPYIARYIHEWCELDSEIMSQCQELYTPKS